MRSNLIGWVARVGAAVFLLPGAMARADVRIAYAVTHTNIAPSREAAAQEGKPQRVVFYFQGERLRMEIPGGVMVCDLKKNKFGVMTVYEPLPQGPFPIPNEPVLSIQGQQLSSIFNIRTDAKAEATTEKKDFAGITASRFNLFADVELRFKDVPKDTPPVFSTSHLEGEVWAAKFEGFSPKLEAAFSRMFVAGFLANPPRDGITGGVDEVSRKILAAWGPGRGIALYARFSQQVKIGAGNPGADKPYITVLEAKEVSQERLPESLFAVPPTPEPLKTP